MMHANDASSSFFLMEEDGRDVPLLTWESILRD
jgi:hypothetical protein